MIEGVDVPGLGVPLDGNMPGSHISRMLSMLGAQADKAQNTSVRSRKRAAKAKRGQ